MDEPSAENLASYKESIKQLEVHPLDPDADERMLLRDKVVAFADDFLEDLDSRPAFVMFEDENSVLYDSPISEESTDPDETADLLAHGAIRSGVNVGSTRHLASIPGSTIDR